ncbi:acyltransferase [Bradyrhizobium manausense]|uniref:acyltransferase family protein n=1 Tax=Bradyrhizobium manausense TaxID=989370 RepID=UPI001BA9310C|nr:acyltransferase [Bradyrhizobium manausense]MBR0687368.1 acyltransferase [Bradyrhizobium manausense]
MSQDPQAAHQISAGARIPELDGARGLAVLSVVIAHYIGEVDHALLGFEFGWMGVYLFFVLSGFLIGSIILERKDSPNFLAVFYAKRGLRILPVYVLTLAATFAAIRLIAPAPWISNTLPTSTYLTFTQNIAMAWRGDYGMPWLVPTWTLAVEEQFYLAVPLLMMLIPARALLPAIVAGIVLCLVTRTALYLAGSDFASRLLLVSNGHVLLIGVLAAYIQHHGIRIPQIVLRLIPLVSIVAFDAIIITAHVHVFLAMVAPLFASYILLAARGWPRLGFLRARWLRALGAISYCLYLVHQPINGLMHGLILGTAPDIATTAQIMVSCAAAAGSVAFATLSFLVLERPLLRFAKTFAYEAPGQKKARHREPSMPGQVVLEE